MFKDFGKIPEVKFSRSRFDLSHGVKTTMSVGTLYPLEVQEVLPGDTFKANVKTVCRVTSAFLKPIVDNLFMDQYSFFVPLRLLYKDYERVFGNPNPSAYTDNDLKEFPTINVTPEIVPGSIGDYLGLPVVDSKLGKGKICSGVSILPFRAFAKIYNEWFRNENSVDEIYVQDGEFQASELPNGNPFSPNNYTGMPPKVGKKKDYFTAGLPSTQKGASVLVPISIGNAPVIASSHYNNLSLLNRNGSPGEILKFARSSKTDAIPGDWKDSQESTGSFWYNLGVGKVNNAPSSKSGLRELEYQGYSGRSISGSFTPLNLGVDDSATMFMDIKDARMAFQLQKMLERDALYGSRINEYYLGHFGVYSPDSRLQFTEYLGGSRIPISIQQVAQTSQGTEDSPLANLAATSQSLGEMKFNKGFTEHGFIVTVGCIRQLHTYQQGIPKLFFRAKREDFYDPLFATISEQPVYKSQLFGYVSDTDTDTDLRRDVFNYNEAWAEYRYQPSKITGQMRSGISNSLDIWHLADYYSEAPTFSDDFTDENSDNIDRVLAVETSAQDNFLVDMWFKTEAIRVLPVYSVPGLVDHH